MRTLAVIAITTILSTQAVAHGGGLLGLILIITLNLKIVTNLKYLTDEWRSLSLKCLIYLSITSATETIYSFNYIFILVTFVFISQIRKHRLPTNILTREF